jgi:hypothetical protein
VAVPAGPLRTTAADVGRAHPTSPGRFAHPAAVDVEACTDGLRRVKNSASGRQLDGNSNSRRLVTPYLRIFGRRPENEEVVSAWVKQRWIPQQLIAQFKNTPEAEQIRFLRWVTYAAVPSYFAISIAVLLGRSMMVGPLPDVTTLQFWTLAILGPLAFFVFETLLLIGVGSILFLLLGPLDS